MARQTKADKQIRKQIRGIEGKIMKKLDAKEKFYKEQIKRVEKMQAKPVPKGLSPSGLDEYIKT